MHPSLLEAQALISLQVHVHNQHTILPCFVTSSIRACMRQRRLAAAACRLNHPLIKAHPAETALMMLYMQLGFAPQLLLLLMLCLGAAERATALLEQCQFRKEYIQRLTEHAHVHAHDSGIS